MKLKDKYRVSQEFEDIFSFQSKEEELEHEAKMMMFRFLSEFDSLFAENPIKKKNLAKEINTSASYITQLYRGDKLINLSTLAKIQDAFDFKFEIKARLNEENYNDEIEHRFFHYHKPVEKIGNREYWMHVDNNPNYENNAFDSPVNNNMKIA